MVGPKIHRVLKRHEGTERMPEHCVPVELEKESLNPSR